MFYTLPNFLFYIALSVGLLATALTVYKFITPYDELALIRARNKAAALSYVGTITGMVIAMGSVIIHSANWLEMVAWCGISLVVQLAVWEAVNWLLGNLHKAIAEEECMAYAIVLGGSSTAMGILQAACLVY